MTAPTLPVYDARALAAALKERNLPGQRSMTAIKRLRGERQRRAGTPGTRDEDQRRGAVLVPLARRADARVIARYTAEIARRGGETFIEGQYGDTGPGIADRAQGLALLRAEGWRKYGRQGNRHVSLAYLCGREDGQTWAVRVPGTVTTVSGALAWIEPAAVRDARYAGRRLTRQGDVYAVETTKAHDGKGELPASHIWDAQARVLAHPQHGTLSLPYPVRFYAQNAYEMGRTGRRGDAD